MVMKHMELQKITRNGVFILGLALVTVFPVAAQPSNANNTNRVETTTRTVERDNDTDWGWLGLLGLAGLAGLLPKKRHVEVRDNRTDQTRSGTGTNN
jgi:MYXO-CTERM domain-containing protein